jgi:hypothetical protein
MMKQILLIGAMSIAVPTMAQTGQSTMGTPTSPSGTSDMGPQSLPPTAATPDAAGTSQSPQAAQSTAVTSPTQIAEVVEQEFPKYSGGKAELSQTQFGAWMASLRAASEPGASADSPEMKTWITQAFAQADTNKSKSVSKAELTAFLTKAAG